MTVEVSNRTEAAQRFFQALSGLEASSLRVLRGSAGKPLGSDLAAFDLFNSIWRPLRRKHPISRLACWQVATAYPWNPALGGVGDLGGSMRRLAGVTGDFDRVKTRLNLLLASSGEALDLRLLQTVRLLAASDVPIAWPQLLEDLSNWYAPARPVQTRWAQAFLRV